MKVSIIVPSFNQGEFIGRTLNSIINQDYGNIEIIVIDGGSTDSTLDVLEEFKDHIDLCISERDGGQSDAINKGLKQATGELVGWLNSDDTLQTDCVSSIVMEFEKSLLLDFIYGDIKIINEFDDVIGQIRGKNISVPDIIWKLDLGIPQQGSFWRVRALKKYNKLLNVDYKVVLDRDIFIRTAFELNCLYLTKHLGNFRYHRSSKSISQTDKWLVEVPILYENLVNRYEHLLTKKMVRRVSAMVSLYESLELVKNKTFQKAIIKAWYAIYTSPSIVFRSGMVKKLADFVIRRSRVDVVSLLMFLSI